MKNGASSQRLVRRTYEIRAGEKDINMYRLQHCLE